MFRKGASTNAQPTGLDQPGRAMSARNAQPRSGGARAR